MVLEHEGYILVEFKDGMKTADQETTEGTELFKALVDDFHVGSPQLVMRLQQLYEIRDVELLTMACRLLVVLIYFLNYFFGNHFSVRYNLIRPPVIF